MTNPPPKEITQTTKSLRTIPVIPKSVATVHPGCAIWQQLCAIMASTELAQGSPKWWPFGVQSLQVQHRNLDFTCYHPPTPAHSVTPLLTHLKIPFLSLSQRMVCVANLGAGREDQGRKPACVLGVIASFALAQDVLISVIKSLECPPWRLSKTYLHGAREATSLLRRKSKMELLLKRRLSPDWGLLCWPDLNHLELLPSV